MTYTAITHVNSNRQRKRNPLLLLSRKNVYSFTLVRNEERPVDVKRRERQLKKLLK